MKYLILLALTIPISVPVHLNGQDLIGQDDKSIILAFPQDKDLNLEVFVEFVRSNLDLPLNYDRNLLAKDSSNLMIKTAGQSSVSPDELLLLLNNTLRIKGLGLVRDTRVDDPFFTIKPIRELRPLVPKGRAENFKTGDIFTEIFSIQSKSTSEAKSYIESFYPSGDSTPVFISVIDGRNELIVTGFKRDMLFVEGIVDRFNGTSLKQQHRFYTARNIDLDELAMLLTSAMSGRLASGSQRTDAESTGKLQVIKQESRRRLLLIGTAQQLNDANQLLEEIDSPSTMRLVSYSPKRVSARQIDQWVRGLLPETMVDRDYRATIDESQNLLLVQATQDIHQKLADWVNEMDRSPATENEDSPKNGILRTYKLKNVKARDILDTLRSIERTTLGSRFQSDRGQRSLNFREPTPEMKLNRTTPQFRNELLIDLPNESIDELRQPKNDTEARSKIDSIQDEKPLRVASGSPADSSLIPGQAKVESYGNTIIVVAEPQVQELYAQLIAELDKRPPQVLIEATVVSIDYSDDYALGIEISSGDRIGAKRVLAFSSFGLSSVNPTTGALSLIPGLGFNGTLVDPDAADAVLRALANHRQARVVSAPRILVNDNSEGELSSIAEVPFTSVNASNTVSTTSFAGFAEAGTSIRVLPNISEGNHVNLDFNVTVNDFSGNGLDGIPPPRQTDDVSSKVTIPDGHTVIVGGLRRKRFSKQENYLPGLEHLSILRLLAGNQTRSSGDELLFIFLKPIILRDDKFRDLRYLSSQEREQACIPDDLPQSAPILIQ